MPAVTVGPGMAVGMPTGGMLPPGADAVIMVEYTQEAMPGTIEVTRPVAPGDGVVRADEDAAAGAELVPAGRPLRAQISACWRRSGSPPCRCTPGRGSRCSPPATRSSRPTPRGCARGRCATPPRVALAALITEAGGEPGHGGIIPDDAGVLEAALRAALGTSDVIVISAGSSVGARDQTAAAVGRLGPPGIWCHGLAIRPGKPTLLAECAGVPVVGLPGNPRSALVVFRLIGMPLVRLVGGCTSPPAEPVLRARLERDLASAAGRLDVVQVRLHDGLSAPVFGLSALLSVLTAADGYVIVPEEATGLDRAPRSTSPCTVDLAQSLTKIMTDSPFIRDVPAARALDAWRSAREAAGCPARLPAVAVSAGRRSGPGHRRAGMGDPLLAAVRRRGHGRYRGPRGRHPRRQRDHPGLPGPGRL